MKNKKQNMKKSLKLTTLGFTLVELLAVIVILAIILVIAVPKVMSVIEDSKKATLESTAKMIASAAEKAKVQNAVLGKDEEITCESIAKINNLDYELCIIEFEGNKAKVTITGKGKFDGLNVCGGEKVDAEVGNEICPIPYGKGSTYITNLLVQEKDLHNGLVQTTATINNETVDAGIRYVGSNPNNKVYFNCKDEYTNDSKTIKYGDVDYVYEGNCEVWRIIGVFDTKSSESDLKGEKRIKIVREDSIGNMSWDSSSGGDSGIENNSGGGINQWGESTYSDGSKYEGSDLMRMLNGYYMGETETCRYCNGDNQGTCSIDCSSSVTPLSATSLNMIDDALWYTGTLTYVFPLSVSTAYEGERSNRNSKICSSGERCNDNVKRTTTWVRKIALMYPSDYAYASTNEDCASNIYGEDSTCDENNWLHPSSGDYWTITSHIDLSTARAVWKIGDLLQIGTGRASENFGVRPALYLSSNVKIIGGDGNDEPYKLSI